MARIFELKRKSTLALRQRKQALLHQLRLPPEVLRASCVEQFLTCGKPACPCHQRTKTRPLLLSDPLPGHRADPQVPAQRARATAPGPRRHRRLRPVYGRGRGTLPNQRRTAPPRRSPPGRVNRLAQFLQYTSKVFELKGLLRSVRDGRSDPHIPLLPLVAVPGAGSRDAHRQLPGLGRANQEPAALAPPLRPQGARSAMRSSAMSPSA